ncbi:YrhB domain-containing protein [Hydrogenophaga sp.]|uniref:YrhB domain-containing protein n=1 Tax=Hydrogenophaga sp. TaxID=1904254 RepID=UPI002FCB2AF0
MTTKHNADEAMHAYLRGMEREMDNFESALPENANRPPHHLVITRVDEYDFGWVYFYNSAEYEKTADSLHAVAGNAPVIVDRTTCKLYSSGTAHPVEHYVEEFRRGIRRPV